MTNYVYIATSLDGYIADINGGIDWLLEPAPPEGDDCGFSGFIKNIEAIVMGRNTYEKVLSFNYWPYTVPVFVLSNTLTQISDNAILLKGAPLKIVDELKKRGFGNLYIDGGKTIQEFLKYDLIDEMIITTIPKLLGRGIPLFTNNTTKKKFKAYKCEILSIDAVKTYYRAT